MTTYRVTRNGAAIATGLTAGQLMASDYHEDAECNIDEERTVDRCPCSAACECSCHRLHITERCECSFCSAGDK